MGCGQWGRAWRRKTLRRRASLSRIASLRRLRGGAGSVRSSWTMLPSGERSTIRRGKEHYPPGQVRGLLDAVGDGHDGGFPGRPQGQKVILQTFPGRNVQGAEGLIHEQDGRVQDQHPGQGDALAHSAGEPARIDPGEIRQPHPFELLAHDPVAFRLPDAPQAQPKGHVSGYGQPGKQGRVLKNHGPVRAGAADRTAVDQDSPGCGPQESGDEVQDGGFPAPALPQDAQEFPGGDMHGQAGQHEPVGLGIGHAHVFQADHCASLGELQCWSVRFSTNCIRICSMARPRAQTTTMQAKEDV